MYLQICDELLNELILPNVQLNYLGDGKVCLLTVYYTLLNVRRLLLWHKELYGASLIPPNTELVPVYVDGYTSVYLSNAIIVAISQYAVKLQYRIVV